SRNQGGRELDRSEIQSSLYQKASSHPSAKDAGILRLVFKNSDQVPHHLHILTAKGAGWPVSHDVPLDRVVPDGVGATPGLERTFTTTRLPFGHGPIGDVEKGAFAIDVFPCA